MATEKVENELIRFILAIEDDKKLLLEFLSKDGPGPLYEFFQKKGFTKISQKDCSEIVLAQQNKGAVRMAAEFIIKEDDCQKGY